MHNYFFRLLFLVLILASDPASAQQTWSGIVLDGNLLEPVAMSRIELGKNTYPTGVDGRFSINIKAGDTVFFTAPGYSRSFFPVEMYPGWRKDLPDTVLLYQGTGRFEIIPQSKVKYQSTVVVSGNRRGEQRERAGQSMEVVKPDFLLRTQSVQVQQSLDKLPGVQVQKDQVTIRGGSGFSYGAGSRVMLLLDEIPMLSADAGDVKWPYLPSENLDQIEVLKGPASTLYGSAALEGVIHLRTAMPADTQFVQLRSFAGFYGKPRREETAVTKSEGNLRFGNTAAFRQRFGKVAVVAGINQTLDNGYREGDDYRMYRGNLLVQYNPADNWMLKASINGMDIRGQDFLFFENTAQPFRPEPGTTSKYHNNRWHTDLHIKHYLPSGSSLTYRTRLFNTTNRNSTNQSSTAYMWYQEIQGTHTLLKKNKFTANLTEGLTYILNTVLSDSLYGFHTGYNPAAYAQVELEYNRRVKLLLGGRFEMFKVDKMEWTGFPVFRSALNVQAATGTFLRASIGQGFRYGTAAERFISTRSGAIALFPNPDIKPEQGWGMEVGGRQLFRLRKIQGYVDVSGFQSRYKNMIEYLFGIYAPAGTPPLELINFLGFAAQNIPSTQILGFEVSTGLQYKSGKFELNFLGGYTYVSPINRDSTADNTTEARNRYLRYRRPHLLRANLEAQYAGWGVGVYSVYNSAFLNMDVFFLDVIEGLAPNDFWQTYSEGYYLDVRLSRKIGRYTELSTFVRNITNEEYMEVPGNVNAPRNYALQLTVTF